MKLGCIQAGYNRKDFAILQFSDWGKFLREAAAALFLAAGE